jgi:hypothetical protein
VPQKRTPIARAFVVFSREIHKHIVARDADHHFGTETDLALIAIAIRIGEGAGRPMTETKLGHFIEMPRATLRRKLDKLRQRGVIVRDGNVYRLSDRSTAAIERLWPAAHKLADAIRLFH